MPKDAFQLSQCRSLNELDANARIHFIGIAGVAMGQLAAALKQSGYRVSGSDKAFYEPMGSFLKEQGFELLEFSADNITSDLDLVVIGNSISYGHPEVERVEELGLKYTCLPQLIYEHLIQGSVSIVASGTHGKTTTSALIAQCLKSLEAEPSYFIGGVVPGLDLSLQAGSGKVSVVEGDEYDSAFFAKTPKFTFYKPDILIINAIEFDHADIYSSLDQIVTEFDSLVRSMNEKQTLIACADFPTLSEKIKDWRETAQAKIISFGLSEDADFQITKLNQTSEGTSFEVAGKSIISPLTGSYNARNCLAAYLALIEAGFTADEVSSALTQANAPKRRQELIHQTDNAIFIEDFAHHPTSVRQTLETFREVYPDKTLWAVFEPASNTSKSNIFEKEFTESLKLADRVIILEPKESLDNGMNFQALAESLPSACTLSSGQDAANYLKQELENNSVVVLMSNGSLGGLKEEIRKI